MKILILIPLLFCFVPRVEAQDDQDKDVRIVFTNALCPPCAVEYPQDADSIRLRQNTLAGLTINTDFPYPGDLLYQANAANNTDIITNFMVSAVPLRIARFAPVISGHRRWPVGLSTRLYRFGTAPNDSLLITCTATVRDALDIDMFRRLYLAIAEQDYSYASSPSNGVSYYANVCRWQKSWPFDTAFAAGQTITYTERIPGSRIPATGRLHVVAFGYNLFQDSFFAGTSDTLSARVTAIRPYAPQLTLWPNPTTDGILRIDGLARPTDYEILETTGRRIAVGITSGTLSLQGRPAGLYMLRIAGRAYRFEVR